MREEFVLDGVNGGPDIQAHCRVGDVTGTLDYWLYGDRLQGHVTFFPSWYPAIDSSPQDFLVISGCRSGSEAKEAFRGGTTLSVHGYEVQFRYHGSRDDHDHPGSRSWEQPSVFRTDLLRWGDAPQKVSDYVTSIVQQLTLRSLQREDAEGLRKLADLAAAADRYEREIDRIEDYKLIVESYKHELAQGWKRANVFAAQRDQHKVLYDAHEARQKQHEQLRREQRQAARPAPSSPPSPLGGSSGPHSNKPPKR